MQSRLVDILEIKQYTEDSITLLFGEEINEETNRKIVTTRKYIEDLKIDGVVETIISYTRLVIYFDVLRVDAAEIIKALESFDPTKLINDNYAYNLVEIPVCYEEEFGPDLKLFEASGLSADEVIKRHSDKEYLVYMLGFMPGFVYLGGLDKSIAMNRLENPRTNIPAGAVGIAGEQTGMYPFDSPGGWNLIGQTPIKLYDLRRGEDTILYDAGDRIIFRSISKEQFEEIKKQVEEGTYEVKITKVGGETNDI